MRMGTHSGLKIDYAEFGMLESHYQPIPSNIPLPFYLFLVKQTYMTY